MHENSSYAAKHFWKTLVVVVVVFVKVAFLMLFFYDALKKMCLLLLPLSIESTLFFFS
tara:strand:- start:149 stop:322 length:174 start_codon:yes stop_codon:yes gene_type:complete